MARVVRELRARARYLHRRILENDQQAIDRLRRSPHWNKHLSDDIAKVIQRRHCLAFVADELGFEGWPHAVAVLEGRECEDFGTLLYPPHGSAHSNIWSASYDEARAIRESRNEYLLAYRKQYFIADRYFVDTLGLDPEDPDWERIGRDWARPSDLAGRQRLYEKLIRIRLGPPIEKRRSPAAERDD